MKKTLASLILVGRFHRLYLADVTGVQWTNRQCVREFMLANKGRKVQTIQWFSENAEAAKKTKRLATGNDTSQTALSSQEDIFHITPERVTLQPMTAQVFALHGITTTPCKVLQYFIVLSVNIIG